MRAGANKEKLIGMLYLNFNTFADIFASCFVATSIFGYWWSWNTLAWLEVQALTTALPTFVNRANLQKRKLMMPQGTLHQDWPEEERDKQSRCACFACIKLRTTAVILRMRETNSFQQKMDIWFKSPNTVEKFVCGGYTAALQWEIEGRKWIQQLSTDAIMHVQYYLWLNNVETQNLPNKHLFW